MSVMISIEEVANVFKCMLANNEHTLILSSSIDFSHQEQLRFLFNKMFSVLPIR